MVFWRSLAAGLKYVVTYHQDVLFAGLQRVPAQLHHRLLGTRILERAAKVLATSWDYARASRLQHLLRTHPQTVGEMPNGVDAQRFHPAVDGGPLRDRLGLAPADAVILFVGGLDSAHFFKGVGNLLQAVAQLRDQHVKVLLVGDGNLRPGYQQQAAQLGLGNRAIFCGRVSDAELPAHYACSDLLVLPSTTMGEAFGVVLLEAMACAKPVIASNLPGVRSVVSAGQDGLLVQPGDVPDLAAKMQALLDDAQRRHEMGQRGCAKVEERYAWPKIIPRLVQVYEEVLGSRGAEVRG
jgi:glycosyltransferase involved in cell wall biosynthesis